MNTNKYVEGDFRFIIGLQVLIFVALFVVTRLSRIVFSVGVELLIKRDLEVLERCDIAKFCLVAYFSLSFLLGVRLYDPVKASVRSFIGGLDTFVSLNLCGEMKFFEFLLFNNYYGFLIKILISLLVVGVFVRVFKSIIIWALGKKIEASK